MLVRCPQNCEASAISSLPFRQISTDLHCPGVKLGWKMWWGLIISTNFCLEPDSGLEDLINALAAAAWHSAHDFGQRGCSRSLLRIACLQGRMSKLWATTFHLQSILLRWVQLPYLT